MVMVRIKVYSCGVCHTDIMMAKGAFPGLPFPVVPGHEVAGRIDEVGEGVTCFKKGDKVGVGYFGGSCHECKQCKQNQWTTCEKVGTTGISFRGGMAEYMIAPCDAVSVIPEEISFAEAGPLMCAGVTTFNSIRSMGIRPGEKVIIQGIGGLGHLAIQVC
ncbi:hypothetical protein DFA_10780 [Cavenderia fasciculata]|uniref:Alcohol dehydrogenase-like N-terminal domain-containing protein n=1 Tax=Cavenderia fasciculata TaxID=261658 RepID=F4QBD5_CACFS|nr:uncharacterized protein DFA_10780 [Cavenderia fasciculata]EGG14907.1 hypothetical protein DFA_10780 [Cavenderia fasciculata]|eukprot:XP_004351423.1 hypothetical protein DFA_10780 [Cavenderia fasciculata]